METGTDTPPLYTLIFGDVGTRGHFSRIYRCGDRDRHTTPIHSLIFGDVGTSLGYIDVETGTGTPPLYTLISGDMGTRGQLPRIYTYGDRDIQYHPIHSHLWGRGDWGHGDSNIGYIHMETGTDHTTLIHSHLCWHGDGTLRYIHNFMSIGADHTTHIHSDLIYIVVYKHVHVETGCIYR